MDFAKLIEQRDKFIADAAAALGRRDIDPDAVKHSFDLQAEQAGRVRERIESLEMRKAEILASVDAELATLRRDLEAREQKIETDRKEEDMAAGAPSVDGASKAKGKRRVASAAAKKMRAASSSKGK